MDATVVEVTYGRHESMMLPHGNDLRSRVLTVQFHHLECISWSWGPCDMAQGCTKHSILWRILCMLLMLEPVARRENAPGNNICDCTLRPVIRHVFYHLMLCLVASSVPCAT
jgi:hypothetical protein